MEYTATIIQPLLRKEFGPASAVETYDSTGATLGGQRPLSVSAATLSRLTGLSGALAIFLVVLFFIVLPIALHILAIYLAATCNRGQIGNMIAAIVVAVIFPIVYLLFYWIYHTLMGNPCNP